jgi:hypothetical protein
MTDQAVATHEDSDEEHPHHPPHMPPPSFAPINVALALAITLTGFLTDIRNLIGPLMWGVGLIYLIVSLFFWARGARREYLELPEDGGH